MFHAGSSVTLIKDCNALLIPSATPIVIPSGTNVQITQAKGGSVTVIAGGNLARIDGKDLDALGLYDSDSNYNNDINYRGNHNKNASGSEKNNNNKSSQNNSDSINQQTVNQQIVEKIITNDVDINLVWDALKTCFDPEIPVNIVDLGLVYECNSFAKEELNSKHVNDSDNTNHANHVEIKMTLTAPGCGMGPVIVSDVEQKVLALPNVTSVNVELIFDPPWTQEMMAPAAKLELGLL